MVSLLFENEKNVNIFEENSIIFKDLNLDYIIDDILRNAPGFNIKNYFYEALTSKNDCLYRHEVFKDLENKDIFDALNIFSYTMNKRIKEQKQIKGEFSILKQVRLKQRITEYLSILTTFIEDISKCDIKSKGIKKMVKYIKDYLNSDDVLFIIKDMNLINEEMSKVSYRMAFENGLIKVDKYEKKDLLIDKINSVLDSYKPEKNIVFTRGFGSMPDHIVGQIYQKISKYYQEEFKHLELFTNHFKNFLDDTILTFVDEIQFYISYIMLMDNVREMNLKFNYPSINENKVFCNEGYDLALALSYKHRRMDVIVNDFLYENDERIIIVSGPNQGGKTTFSRYLGQTFYLGMLGLPVTGDSSSLKLVSNICTMYEVEEDASNLNGKLKSELYRIKDIMDTIGNSGLLIMNEVFSSTSLEDGIVLGKKIIDMLNNKNAYGIFVTFIEELASYNKTTVSMGSTVDKNDPSIRTFEILRRLDNSKAYAKSIAKKNNVSYDDIIRRIG